VLEGGAKMAADGEGKGKSVSQARDNAEVYDNAEGMSLVDFCVQLDDCTPTVSGKGRILTD
jgi:hypothetical protein